MRISDWSSDVCSSDLVGHEPRVVRPGRADLKDRIAGVAPPRLQIARGRDTDLLEPGGVVILGVVEQIIDVAVADQIRAIKPGPFPFGAVRSEERSGGK